MALSRLGKSLLLLSVVIGLLAAFAPSINVHQHLPPALRAALSAAGCPLGYGPDDGPLPENHPPVAGQKDTVVPGVRIKVLAVYYNGTIWTATDEAPEAMVVDEDDGSVMKLGTLQAVKAEAMRVAQETVRRKVEVQMRDLQGAFLMPGLIDPHVHLVAGGLMLSHVDLSPTSSKAQFIEVLSAAARQQAETGWLLGGGWNEQRWGGQLPDKSWLDEAVGSLPAFVTRSDLHCGVASSEALRLAGIGPDTPDPPGGKIERGKDGQPTGLLRDKAVQLVSDLVSQPSLDQRLEAVFKAGSHALSKGITTVGDMGRLWSQSFPWDDFSELYYPLADNWTLPLRIHAYLPLKSWSRLAALVAADGYVHSSGRLFWGGVKEFADGSLGSCTALMTEPYAACEAGGAVQAGGEGLGDSCDDDSSGRCGIRLIEKDRLRGLVDAADAAGLQVAVHAIGDKAVDDVASIFQEVAKLRSQRLREAAAKRLPTSAPDTTPPSRPFRIEHAQHLSGAAAAAALSHSDIMAVANPLHLLDDASIALQRLGPKRAAAGRAFAYQTMASAGVALAFGSDWPVAGLEPLVAVHAAAHRRPPGQDACCGTGPRGTTPAACFYSSEEDTCSSGSAGVCRQAAEAAEESLWPWLSQEAVKAEAALLAHTREAAKALMMQDYVGSLREGMRADLVILEHSPLEGPWNCEAPKVLSTFLDGACVYGCDAAPWKLSKH